MGTDVHGFRLRGAMSRVGSVRHWPVTPRRLQDIAYTATGGVPLVDVRCGNMIVSASVVRRVFPNRRRSTARVKARGRVNTSLS